MKALFVVLVVVAVVGVGAFFFVQKTDAGRRLKLGLLRAGVEVAPTPDNIGRLAAEEVRLRPGLVPKAQVLTPAEKEAIRQDVLRRLPRAPLPGGPMRGGSLGVNAQRVTDELIRIAEGIDQYGRDPNEQQAAIAASVAGTVARSEGFTPDEINQAANVAVQQFGFPDIGHVTLVLTGRPDWAAAIVIMAAAVGGIIAAGVTGGAAGAVIAGAATTAGLATQ